MPLYPYIKIGISLKIWMDNIYHHPFQTQTLNAYVFISTNWQNKKKTGCVNNELDELASINAQLAAPS